MQLSCVINPFHLILIVVIIRILRGDYFCLMTDEERQRAMDFIVEQQAQLSVNQQKGEERTSRLERILKLSEQTGK